MALNYVTLTLDLYDGQGNPVSKGTATFTPSAQLTDTTDHELIIQQPVVVSFQAGGLPAVKLLATDNAAPQPAGWTWSVAFAGMPAPPASFSFFLPFAGGSAQNMSALAPVASGVTASAFLPVAAGPGFQPADLGLLAWNYDPAQALTDGSPTNNTLALIRVNVRAQLSCTNVVAYTGAGGTGLTSGQNFAGLYSSTGTLIGTTADQHTPWASIGLQTMALAGGPFALAAGFYWVALLPNESAGSTPAFLRTSTSGLTAAALNAGTSVSTSRWATNGTGTSLPPSVTPGSNAFLNAPYWAGLS